MDDRARVLAEIAALASRHGLTLDEIAAAIGPAAPAGESRARSVIGPAEAGHHGNVVTRGVIVTVLGVLGGTFVFAGVGVFIALQWEDMNAASRVVVTLGSGVAALILSLLAVRDPRFVRAHTPLLLTAAVLQPFGMLVAFDEFGTGGDWRYASLVTSGAMALQFGVLSNLLGRSTPVFLTIFFGTMFWWTALDIVEADGTVTALVLGLGLLSASIGLARTPHRDVTPLWYFIGGALLLHGVFDSVERTAFEIVFLAFAAGLVYLSVVVHSRALLAVSTLGILAYTGWFTAEHFAESVGWPLALVAFGLFMIGLSAAAYRIDRDYVRK